MPAPRLKTKKVKIKPKDFKLADFKEKVTFDRFKVEQFRSLVVLSRAADGDCTRANAEQTMCDECIELGKKIDHYTTICARISDEKTVEGIRKLIAEMEAQKAALHAVGR